MDRLRFFPDDPVSLEAAKVGAEARAALAAAFARRQARKALWTDDVRARFEDLVDAFDPGPGSRRSSDLVRFIEDLFDDAADAALLEAARGREPDDLAAPEPTS